HRRVDIIVRRVWLVAQQRRSGHDHSWLAVAALGDILFNPGLLARMATVDREAFNSGVALSGSLRDWDLATSHRRVVLVDRAGAADADPASVLGSGHLQQVAQNPQQRRLRVGGEAPLAAVDWQEKSGDPSPPSRRRRTCSCRAYSRSKRWPPVHLRETNRDLNASAQSDDSDSPRRTEVFRNPLTPPRHGSLFPTRLARHHRKRRCDANASSTADSGGPLPSLVRSNPE